MHARLVTAAGTAAALVMGVLFAGCTPPKSYVALGDSFTAGPAITPVDSTQLGCLRSDANYPTLLAPGTSQPVFRDVSCSGAQTRHMTQTQDVTPNPDNPPQLQALDANTAVVTLGIGGNDIGFSELAKRCAELGIRNPTGSPCRDHYTAGGVDQIGERIAALRTRLAPLLDEIARRAPRAKVFVVGYPAILPETTAGFFLCQPTLPVATGDVAFLRDQVQKRLNAAIQAEAVADGDVYVDTYPPSIGHDACKAPSVRWVEPVVPASDAAPVHPNRLGMRGMADAVRAAMRAHGVAA